MLLPTIESLLEDWRKGQYYEVAQIIERMGPKYAVQFCNMLVKYEGVHQVNILDKLMN